MLQLLNDYLFFYNAEYAEAAENDEIIGGRLSGFRVIVS
jgi:hypothetical protein